MNGSPLTGILVSLVGIGFFCLPGLVAAGRMMKKHSSPLALAAVGFPCGLVCTTALSVCLACVTGRPLLSAVLSTVILTAAAALVPGISAILEPVVFGKRRTWTAVISLAAVLGIIIGPLCQVGVLTDRGHAYGNYFNVDFLKNLALATSLGRTGVPAASPYLTGFSLRYYWFYLWLPSLLYRAGLQGACFEAVFLCYASFTVMLFVGMLFLWWKRLGVASRWCAATLLIALGAPGLNGTAYIVRLWQNGNLKWPLVFAQNVEFITPLNFAAVPFFVDSLFRYLLYIQLHLFGAVISLLALYILFSPGKGGERKALVLSAALLAIGLFYTDVVSVLGVMAWVAGALHRMLANSDSVGASSKSAAEYGRHPILDGPVGSRQECEKDRHFAPWLILVFVCLLAVMVLLLPGNRAGIHAGFLFKLVMLLVIETTLLLTVALFGIAALDKGPLRTTWVCCSGIPAAILLLVGERSYLQPYLPDIVNRALAAYPFHISVKCSLVLTVGLCVLAAPGFQLITKYLRARNKTMLTSLATITICVLFVVSVPGAIIDCGYHLNAGEPLRNVYFSQGEMSALIWMRTNTKVDSVFLSAPIYPGSPERPSNSVSPIPSLGFRDTVLGDRHHILIYTGTPPGERRVYDEIAWREREITRLLASSRPGEILASLRRLNISHLFLGPRETEVWGRVVVERLRSILPRVYDDNDVSIHEVR